jgi:acetyl-CoA acetyltransferase
MDIYAVMARRYMEASGATKRHFAQIVAKNSFHGSLNEHAQFRDVLSIEDVLNARGIVEPLTLPMCSPLGDGAAAAVLVSPTMAKKLGIKAPVFVRSSILASGANLENLPDLTSGTAQKAFQQAGIGPDELDCVELHDATAPAEMMYYEALGLCAPGDGPSLVEEGATTLGGRIPVSVSGGLIRKGHPIGTTGLAQIYELTQQLRGLAGARQVEGARVALAENGGGWLGHDAAAIVITVLTS